MALLFQTRNRQIIATYRYNKAICKYNQTTCQYNEASQNYIYPIYFYNFQCVQYNVAMNIDRIAMDNHIKLIAQRRNK